MSTMAERWEEVKKEYLDKTDLRELVRDFFEILDKKEISDSDVEFSPNYISSCRVFDTHKLKAIITRMKELSKT